MKKIVKLHTSKNLYDRLKFHLKDEKPFVERFYSTWVVSMNNKITRLKDLYPDKINILNEIYIINDSKFQIVYQNLIKNFSQISICHNDLSLNNILFNGDYAHPEIKIIDFEYLEQNYIAFDIAFLIEECEVDYQYPMFPFFKFCEENKLTEEEQNSIIKHYCSLLNNESFFDKELSFENLKSQIDIFLYLIDLYSTVWGLAFHEEKDDWKIEY